jgi:hypothetical protein
MNTADLGRRLFDMYAFAEYTPALIEQIKDEIMQIYPELDDVIITVDSDDNMSVRLVIHDEAILAWFMLKYQ